MGLIEAAWVLLAVIVGLPILFLFLVWIFDE
jgi:hypothetical protein